MDGTTWTGHAEARVLCDEKETQARLSVVTQLSGDVLQKSHQVPPLRLLVEDLEQATGVTSKHIPKLQGNRIDSSDRALCARVGPVAE